MPLQGQSARLRFHGRPGLMHQLNPALGDLYVIRGRRHRIVHIVLVILIAVLLVLPAKKREYKIK